MGKNEQGFSLIELLIVVAIILIIAAIAIPNLLRSKMSANEASAAGSMRLFTGCLFSYAINNPDTGFPDAITELGPLAGGGNGCLDDVLTAAANGGTPKSGYAYTYTPTNPIAGVNTGYFVNADPVGCTRTGVRTYFTDDTGVIRFNNDPGGGCPPADATSSIMN